MHNRVGCSSRMRSALAASILMEVSPVEKLCTEVARLEVRGSKWWARVGGFFFPSSRGDKVSNGSGGISQTVPPSLAVDSETFHILNLWEERPLFGPGNMSVQLRKRF